MTPPPDPLTPADLAAIEARAAAASNGPWTAHELGFVRVGSCTGRVVAEALGDGTEHGSDADAEFIAHARTDVPALLSLIRRMADECMVHEHKRMRLVEAVRTALRYSDQYAGDALAKIRAALEVHDGTG